MYIKLIFYLVHLGKFLDEEPRHTCSCLACNRKGCAEITGEDCPIDPTCGTLFQTLIKLDKEYFFFNE